jgi:hypothetical protein
VDRAFGKGGVVREALGADPEEGPVRVALQRDGKIVFAGATGDRNRDRQLGDGVVAVYRLRRGRKPGRVVRVPWRDGSYTIIDSVDHFSFNSGLQTTLFTLAHEDSVDT